MTKCKHAVTHTGPDGKTECLVCEEVLIEAMSVALERAYEHARFYAAGAPMPEMFTGLSGKPRSANG